MHRKFKIIIAFYIGILLFANVVLLISEQNTFKYSVALMFATYLHIAPLFLFRLKTRTYMLLTIPLYLITALQIVHFIAFNDLLSYGAIIAIMETNPIEAWEFVESNGILLSTLALFGLYAVMYFFIENFTFNVARPAKIALCGAGLFFLTDYFVYIGPSRWISPLYYRTMVKDYLKEKQIFNESINYSKNVKLVVDRGASEHSKDDQNEIYVLVLGESMSRHQLATYGYHKNTTPRLASHKDIIWFKDAISPASTTVQAIPQVLTSNPQVLSSNAVELSKEDITRSVSIVSVINRLGFMTYWISNQPDGLHDAPIQALAHQSDDVRFLSNWYNVKADEDILKNLKEVLRQPAKKKFIVVHLMGNHFTYSKRYPHSFEYYKTSGVTGDEHWVNSYDNSIRYSDYILSNIISQVKRENEQSWVLYLSDHGEEINGSSEELFGDQKTKYFRCGHGFPKLTKKQVEIPLFFWYSGQYANAHSEKVDEINNNKSRPVSSRNLFHVICGLFDIRGDIYERKRDFFDAAYEGDSLRSCVDVNRKIIRYIDLK